MRARVVIDSRCRVLLSEATEAGAPQLLGERAQYVLASLKSAFEHENPTWGRRRATGLPTTGEERVIKTWRSELCDGAWWLSLPRGGLRRAVDVLRGAFLSPTFEDRRTFGEPDLAGQIPPHRFPSGRELHGYQHEAIDAAVAGQNCLVRSSTGTGKTSLALALAARLNLPTLVIVNAGSLFDQWVERCWSELGIEPHHVGMVREGLRSLHSITIAMQQSLAAHPEWVEANARTFGLVLFDEVQLASAPTCFAAVDRWESRYRIGVSNDERRPDGKEFLIYDLFGRIAADIPRERVEREGHVLAVDVRVVPTSFEASWYRGAMMSRSGPARTRAQKRLLDEMCLDRVRNDLIAELAVEEAQRGESVLVLSARRDHCHLLDAELARRGVLGGLLIGGKPYAQRFRETRDGIREGRLRAGCGTFKAVGMATDIPALSRGIVATPLASSLQPLDQARGRFTRVRYDGGAKSSPIMYYLLDDRVLGLKPLRNIARWYGDRVTVLEGGEWVPARDYLRRVRSRRVGAAQDPELEGLFDG